MFSSIMALLGIASLLFALLASFVSTGGVSFENVNGRPRCTVYAHGGNKSDVSSILRAFRLCGTSGEVIFPEDQNYWIAEKLKVRFNDVRVEWRGQWTFSDDISYWRSNSYPIAFQNHRASFILSGKGIIIDGHGTGGINGNGDVWYSAEAGNTMEGRPMPLVFWNVSGVAVKNFFVNQPPLWAINIMNGTNLEFETISCNATATKAPKGHNWVQNTDGFDTMDVNNVRLTNFVYQGGDDCIAIKPRSYNVEINNVICNGGNGIAIGSLGQYLEDASVMNVVINNATLRPSNQLRMLFGTYIKTWVGQLVPQEFYESGGQARGGGWGSVRNIVFSNFNYERSNHAPLITQDEGNNGSYSGTSLIELSNIAFMNFTGSLSSTTNRASISCSSHYPCYNIDFKGMNLLGSDGEELKGTCKYVSSNGVRGLPGC